MHRQIMAGTKPRRLCIATTLEEKGLYERLTGARTTSPDRTLSMAKHAPRTYGTDEDCAINCPWARPTLTAALSLAQYISSEATE